MQQHPFWTQILETDSASQSFGQRLAGALRPGDTVALQGPLGAGKSTIARAIIRALVNDESLEVPSPTFTLVQTYGSPAAEIWHVDLYRIEEAAELDALGLEDAFGEAIVLIEWPDRLGDRLPGSSLVVELRPTDANERSVSLTGADVWSDRLGSMRS